ncbi:MAG: hypothetical protein EXX96DRAFT_243008 [Benjaminiella poitrasii]|nr:MAG: hypothetical protein EXX96DRAFT_243008 [Benjaminiella poitrasii]
MSKRTKHINKKTKIKHTLENQETSPLDSLPNNDENVFDFELTGSPKKSIHVEQEEKLLQEDPISSFSQRSQNSAADQWTESSNRIDANNNDSQISFDLLSDPNDSQKDPSWSQIQSEANDSQLSASLLFDLDSPVVEDKAESIISEFSDDNDTILSFTEEETAKEVREQEKEKEKKIEIASDAREEEPEEEYEFVMPTAKDIPSSQLISSLEFEFDSPHNNEPSSSQMIVSSLEFELEPPIEGSIGKYAQFKKGGLADTARRAITKEKESFHEWEETVNSQMAEYGSIVKVCRLQPESHLYRMIERWTEGGLVFAWCVPLKEEEIRYLLPEEGASLHSINSSNNGSFSNTQNDSIKDFASQTTLSLPTYLSQSESEKELFAFSFAYVSGYVPVRKFIEKEQVVGIWPTWTKFDIATEKYGLCKVNFATRFKANSIY